MQKYAILVSSCDLYQDILDVFFELLHRFWKDLSVTIYLSTESIEYKSEFFDIKNVHPNNRSCTWTERISEALEEIEEEYIVLLLDDFFIYKNVDVQKIDKCINWMEENKNISEFIFYPIYGPTQETNYDGFRKLQKDTLYKIVAGIAGLWRKKDFLKYTKGYKEDIWLWERNATMRAKTKYKKDEFYITKNLNENVIFYDFSKYGLFSGQWLKPTIELFKELNININFNDRKIFDESYRGKTNSIIKAYDYRPAIIPNYDLNHNGSSYMPCKDKVNNGFFIQNYNLKKASKIIKWETNIQMGFGIKDLVVKIIYDNNKEEIVTNENLFGSYIYYNDMYVFNSINPSMYIVTSKNDYIKKLIITGNNVFPLDEKTLLETYMKETKPKAEYEKLVMKINRETVISKEKIYYMCIEPSLINTENGVKCKLYNYDYQKNKFKHYFIMEEKIKKVKYTLNDYAYYKVKKLKFFVKKDDKWILLDKDMIHNLPLIINKSYIFTEPSNIEIYIPNNSKELLVTGVFKYPLSSKEFKKSIE